MKDRFLRAENSLASKPLKYGMCIRNVESGLQFRFLFAEANLVNGGASADEQSNRINQQGFTRRRFHR